MNDFNSAYTTATNVELARQEANRRAVATNSQIKAQNIIDDKNMQELKELRYNFDRKQREDDIVDMNECADALARGDVMAANWMIANNSTLRSNVEQFGFRGSFMGHKEINPTLHQSTKEALARELGVMPEELSDNDIVYTQGDNGMPQAQYIPFWTPYIPKREGWLQAKNYQTALQTLDVSQKTANLGKTQAEIQNTQAKTEGQQIQNVVDTDKGAAIQAALDAWKRGEDVNTIFQNLSNFMAATKGDLEPPSGPKASEQVAQSKVLDYNLKQQTVQELNDAGQFFTAAQEQDNKRSTEAAIGIANLNYRKFRNSLGIKGNMTAAQAADLLQSMPGIEQDASLALHKHLTANENAKRLFFESVGLASLNAAGMSPGDVGFIDSYFGLLRDKTGIDFTDKPMEALAVGIAGVLGTAQLARNNSYMAKAESSKLLSLIASTGKSYVANLDALEATYTQNLRNINELTRSVEMAEVVYAPIKESTEQAIQFVKTARELYKIDSDAPNKIAATKYVKMSDGNMHLMVALPPENADTNQDFSQVPDDSPIWYTLINGKLVNSQKQVYGGN